MITKIGVTEAGDAGIDLSWVDKLYNINIIISKFVTVKNTKFLSSLLQNKDKIILHITCTGYGGTVIEPNVPTPTEIHDGVLYLIENGFPVKQMVLRTDPIIPTEKGISVAKSVWNLFSDTGITRCRFSSLDMYSHVKQRFIETIGKVPYESFTAPTDMMKNLIDAVENCNYYCMESCAENFKNAIGCVSKKDFDILNISYDQPSENGFQRKSCLCCAGKTELLKNKQQCPAKCLYCYWK